MFLVSVVFVCAFAKGSLGSDLQGQECDPRYFQHYEVKGCRPVTEHDKSKCPTRFECPDTFPFENREGCVFRGKTFLPGQGIPTSRYPCQICSCRNTTGSPDIVCIGIECSSGFGPPLNDSCHEVYEKGACCSNRTECGTQEEPLCSYGGIEYFRGQRIYPEEDPCALCTCGPGWTGDVRTDSSNCIRLDCTLEKRTAELRKGCLPIYHEKTCCPIHYYCGENLPKTNTPFATDKDIESCNTCVFKGSHYRIGQVLDIAQPCVNCTCTTPPEFTCIFHSCPYPDDDSCIPTYSADACCPTFDCPDGGAGS